MLLPHHFLQLKKNSFFTPLQPTHVFVHVNIQDQSFVLSAIRSASEHLNGSCHCTQTKWLHRLFLVWSLTITPEMLLQITYVANQSIIYIFILYIYIFPGLQSFAKKGWLFRELALKLSRQILWQETKLTFLEVQSNPNPNPNSECL